MAVVIENPIINSPFEEPVRHFRFTDEGITNEVVEQRRVSAYFIPIPRARKTSRRQMDLLDNEYTADRVQENDFINRKLLRERACRVDSPRRHSPLVGERYRKARFRNQSRGPKR